jgi:hypothetical protein
LVGCIFGIIGAILKAGDPVDKLCGIEYLFIALAYITIVGSISLKVLGVLNYRCGDLSLFLQ